MKKCLLLLLAIQTSLFLDIRDQNSYSTVEVADQIWLKENLKFISGDNSGLPSNPKGFYEKYGGYYTSSSSKTACPEGYHLPSIDEWRKHIATIPGKKNTRGGKLINKDQLEVNALATGGMGQAGTVMMENVMGYYWTRSDTLKPFFKTPEEGPKKHLIAIHIWSSGEQDSINIEPTYMLASSYQDKVALNCKCVRDNN